MIDPAITPNAIAYAWERLLDIAGAEDLAPPYAYGPANAPLSEPGVVIIPAAPDAWSRLLELPAGQLDWLPAKALFPPEYPLPFHDPVPILFWSDADRDKPPIGVRADGSIIFRVDLIAAALFMLTRWEEIVLPQRDEHDRFPAIASTAYRQGFLDQPIVDRYAMILRAWLQRQRPSWQPRRRTFHLHLSHDIDHLRRFLTANEALRQTANNLWRQKRPRWALEDVRDFATGRLLIDRNPYLTVLDDLANMTEMRGDRATFYIMAATPNLFDEGFTVTTPALTRRLQRLARRGHIIGVHPGYYTYLDFQRYRTEKNRLEQALGEVVHHARQHYLRFRVPDTWRIAVRAGIREDATLGYADMDGFRCGTAHSFPVFDILADEAIPIIERPLHIMDGTLKSYRNLTADEALRRMQKLAQRAAQVEGELHLLWHNKLYYAWRPWFQILRRFLNAPLS